MPYFPGSTFASGFNTISVTTRQPRDADSTPTATLYRNGTADGAVTCTVTNIATGVYKVTGTIPSGYAAGDAVMIDVSATVGGVPGRAWVDSFQVGYSIASIWNYALNGVHTAADHMRIFLAVLAGRQNVVMSGGTSSYTIYDAVDDTTVRVAGDIDDTTRDRTAPTTLDGT